MPPLQADQFIKGMDRLAYKLYGGLARIFGALAARNEETYWFGIVSDAGRGFVNLTAVIGDAPTATIEVSQEADFVATRFLAFDLNPTTGVPITGSWSITSIRDGGSDRELQNTPIHRDTIVGTAQRSVPFTKNRLFRRNSSVTFTFNQLQAVATQIWLVAQGYKVYDEAALDLVRRR